MKISSGILSFIPILLIILTVTGSNTSSDTKTPVYIGALLPLTGPEGLPLFEALELGEEQINSAGGIGGRPVHIVYRDTRTGNLTTYARELAKDPEIQVVIGPYTYDDLFAISDLFERNEKVLVTPSASSDEIFRAFSGTGNVWRLTTNDRDITSVVVQHLTAHHAQSVALLTPNNSYGRTFYDWIPFWTLETGVDLTGSIMYTGSGEIPAAISHLQEQDPDYIIFVYSGTNQDIVTALKTLKAEKSQSHLYLIQPNMYKDRYIQVKPDTATLMGTLVSGQWELQSTSTVSVPLPDDTLILMSPSPDPAFIKEYTGFSGKEPSGYVSEVYDSLLVSAGIMARFISHPEQSPMKAANTVLLNGSGRETQRTVSGIRTALQMILNEQIPVMTGATGPLTFVPDGPDRKIPWYQTYTIKNGLVTGDPIQYQAIGKKEISPEGQGVPQSGIHQENTTGGDFWAVIGGLSRDWSNYRHQADALTMYQILKEQGVPDDHIILMVYDDIPFDPRNIKPGEVFHIPKQEEVRKTAIPDFSRDQMNKQMVEDIVSGTGPSPDSPALGSDEKSTLLLYLASHSAEGGRLIIGKGEEMINPDEFAGMIEKMKDNKKFGKMLIIIESCFSGSLADRVTTPGVLLMTAAGKNETSKSAIYDSELSSWISDEFTSKLTSIIRESGDLGSVRDLYAKIYPAVRSSHPGIYNLNNSFSLDTPMSVFFGG